MDGDQQRTRATDLAALRAAEREERLLSQDLHDSLCQSLVGVSLLVQALKRSKKLVEIGQVGSLGQISAGLDTAIEQSRTLMQSQVLSVRPNALPELLGKLTLLAGPYLACEFHSTGQCVIHEPEVARVLYRVARESLQNIIREAQATKVKIELVGSVSELALRIHHDGRARRPDAETLIVEGDGILRKFVEAVGLKWSIESHDGGGASVCCRWAGSEIAAPPPKLSVSA